MAQTRRTSLLAKRSYGLPSAAKWLLSVAVCLLLVQGGRTQSLSGRIDRSSDQGANRPTLGSSFYVLQGKSITFNCFCNGYESVEILHNGSPLKHPESCPRLIYTINSTTSMDDGLYSCRGRLTGGSHETLLLGNMTTIDPVSVVQAEPQQYGFLNTRTELNCSTTLDQFTFLVIITWFKEVGESKILLDRQAQFSNTAISDEASYVCEVDITEMGIVIERRIDFKVIVPPRIFHEDEQLEFFGNTRQEIIVPFQSRFMNNTQVSWWKNDNLLTANIHREETAPPNSTTTLTLNPARRNDSGVYKVAVENRFGVIPRELQYREVCLRVTVIVRPAKPVISVSEPLKNAVSWTVPQGINEDARADYFTISLNFSNGTVAQERALNGDDREAQLSVVPGMSYVVAITAHNQDGETKTDVQEFTTPPGAPSVPFVQVNRLSNSSVEIIVNLAYTGGGNITDVHVSFREIGTSEWIVIGFQNAHSMSEMTWMACVSDDRFIGIGVEFQVAVRNTHGHSSQPVELFEPLDPPGAPTLEGISMSYDSLTIQLTFSTEGTPPILSLVVEFIAPKPFTRNFSGPFIQGEVHSVRITGLQDSTQYSFTLSAVNYQGRGRLSSVYNSTTTKRPPLPLHAIILIAIAAAALVVIIIVILAVVFMVMSKRHKQKKTYFFNNQRHMDMTSEDKQLDSNHEMVRRGSNSYTQHKPSLPSSRSILSTSTTNSSYLPTSPPFSPPGAPPILRISDPSSVERYRYETCSSVTSNSGQSDESDAGIRYTYNISPSPPAVEVDTPDLRAQSTYSVMTTTTRMTSSSNSTSTRESLTYTHESNATVV